MSRTSRLLELMQLLREYRLAVSASELAQRLNVSERTLYRDINTLRTHGVCIDGEKGGGFRLTEQFTLPPMTFTDDELLAISIGLRWIQKNTDIELGHSAKRVLAKIGAVISSEAQIKLKENGFTIIHHENPIEFLKEVRQSISQGFKLNITYSDLQNNKTTRIIWPCALGFIENSAIIAAWCELRGDFRNFRLDRIEMLERLEYYPIASHQLLQKWQKLTKINLD